MTGKIPRSREIWALVRSQHGVIARRQLLDLGLTRHAIAERLKGGRLHRLHKGVYSVGRPELTALGRWMAAVLAAGPGAVLSGVSAAVLWGILKARGGQISVTIPAGKTRARPGLRITSRSLRATDRTTYQGIPVTTPVGTLIDLALSLTDFELERAVVEADKLDLVDPERLRSALEHYRGVPGARKLRELLDRRTFTLTDSALEQLFLPIAAMAGLAKPLTQQWGNGFRVDFYWPEHALVVETDGLRHHRTPAQQARAHKRDQVHTAAGVRPLRFTHAQIRFEPDWAEEALRSVAQAA